MLLLFGGLPTDSIVGRSEDGETTSIVELDEAKEGGDKSSALQESD